MKLYYILLFLALISCSKIESDNFYQEEKGYMDLDFKNSVKLNSNSKTKSTNNISTPDEIIFENHYNYYNSNDDIKIELKENQETLKVPLDFGTYDMCARAYSSYTYDHITNDGNGNTINVEKNTIIKYYSKNSYKPFTIDSNNRNGKGLFNMEIINGPMIIRFEQICNHPNGKNKSNPHWQKASNKSIEYIVDIRYKERIKGIEFISRFEEGYSEKSYTNENRHAYKVYVFYHEVFVFDMGKQSLKGKVKNNNGSLYAYSRCKDLNNNGFYDFDLPNSDRAEVNISYKKLVNRDYPKEDYNYSNYVRKYIQGQIDYISYVIDCYNTNNKLYYWEYYYDKYFKLSKKENNKGKINTLCSEIATLKKYRIGMKEYDGRRTKTSKVNNTQDMLINTDNIKL